MRSKLNPLAYLLLVTILMLTGCADMQQAQYTNSIGMKFVRVTPGTFQMGQLETLPSEVLPIFRGRGLFDTLKNGDYDEKPTHTVKISSPYYVGMFEVTNAQYELFDPAHKKYRGKRGLSKDDNEAVTYVNWYEAIAFCKWLSDLEGIPYRLPTEAEWEFACRAGTTTNFATGDVLGEEFTKEGKTNLLVGQTPPNTLGIYDMHANLEEWCHDWYGPYIAKKQTDPIGYSSGEFRVTRGGDKASDMYFARSANRMGAIPESRNWVTGFRVVIARTPETKPLTQPKRRHQTNVVPRRREVVKLGPDKDKPYFRGPLRYVNMPRGSNGPTFTSHNHDPAIVECPNGDLLSIWYTCHDEHGRELALAASRLKWRAKEWEQASLFFYVPDRNNHAPSLWFNDDDKIYNFSGVSASRSRGLSAIAMRTSDDSGKTWTPPRLIVPEFDKHHLPSEPVFRMNDGQIAFSIDGPNTLWMSKDEGLSWYNPGGHIRGIHTAVNQLSDGRIFALSRGIQLDGKMPISLSSDAGKSFTEIASPFPTIDGGQRTALVKLRTGELFVASFTNEKGKGILITDVTGNKREVRGLFAAMSEDDGKTWPYIRLITDDGPARTILCTDGACVAMSARNSEYRGYLSACESLDERIHVISSINYFTFNKKWLKTKPPAPVDEPRKLIPVVETFTGPDKFDDDQWQDYKGPIGHFNGKGQYTLESGSHFNGINRPVAKGSFEAVFSATNIKYNKWRNRPTEGLTMGFRDPMSAGSSTMFVFVQENEIRLRAAKPDQKVILAQPAGAIKLKFIYNDKTHLWRVFYGLDGDEPTIQIGSGSPAMKFKEPTSESLAAYILMSQGSADLDYVEIKPIE
ncbi:MAG: SUMF1/EgtB/PvdO family nonheme iron enzyme [Planctomycetota bacterium]|jgi:formylglycine-generating enzyme required for sulfatase activity